MLETSTFPVEFKDLAQEFNEAFLYLEKQTKAQIDLCKDRPGSSPEHFLCLFDWTVQSFLHRGLHLADAYASQVNNRDALISAIVGRSLVENVAYFHHLLNLMDKNLTAKKYAKAYHLLVSITLAGKQDFQKSTKNLASVNVMAALRDLDKTYTGVLDSYGWLSEFSHPNSLGVITSFSQMDKENSKIRFCRQMREVSNSSPMIESAISLVAFKMDWSKVNQIRHIIIENWEASEDVFKYFESPKQSSQTA